MIAVAEVSAIGTRAGLYGNYLIRAVYAPYLHNKIIVIHVRLHIVRGLERKPRTFRTRIIYSDHSARYGNIFAASVTHFHKARVLHVARYGIFVGIEIFEVYGVFAIENLVRLLFFGAI